MPKEKQLEPQLRFPEFNGEWEKKKIGETVIINPKITELPNSFIYIDLESVNNGVLSKENKISKNEAPSRAQRLLSNDDILYQTVRPYQKNNFYFNKSKNDYVASTGYAQIRSKHNKSSFIYQYLHSEYFVKKVLLRCTGTSYPAINSTDLSKIRVNFPPVPEQQKIADFLTSVDTHIQTLEKKKAALELYKKGVTQKIFKQDIRFKDNDGNEFPEWKKRKLGDILIEVNKKTTKTNEYPILSSTAKGLFNQSEYFTRDIASKNNTGYKIIKKNQLVFSPQNLWLGNININLNFEIGIVSPSYKVFNFENKYTSFNFCRYLLFTKKMFYEYSQASEQGASIVRRNLDINSFKAIIIYLPSLIEQTKIANFLSSIDKQIEGVAQQIEHTKTYKKGLLQQMFV